MSTVMWSMAEWRHHVDDDCNHKKLNQTVNKTSALQNELLFIVEKNVPSGVLAHENLCIFLNALNS